MIYCLIDFKVHCIFGARAGWLVGSWEPETFSRYPALGPRPKGVELSSAAFPKRKQKSCLEENQPRYEPALIKNGKLEILEESYLTTPSQQPQENFQNNLDDHRMKKLDKG